MKKVATRSLRLIGNLTVGISSGGRRHIDTGNPVRSERCSELCFRLPPWAPHAPMPRLDPRRPVKSQPRGSINTQLARNVSIPRVGAFHSGAVATGAARLRRPARRQKHQHASRVSHLGGQYNLVQYSERLGPWEDDLQHSAPVPAGSVGQLLCMLALRLQIVGGQLRKHDVRVVGILRQRRRQYSPSAGAGGVSDNHRPTIEACTARCRH